MLNTYPERVHVAPVGFEVDRVVLPFLEMKGERIHLIVRKGGNQRGDKCVKEICRDLDAKGKPYKVHESELELFRLIYTCRKTIQEELGLGNHVFVNISSGGGMHAVACHFATLTFRQGVSAYYAYPAHYNEHVDPNRPGTSSGLSKIELIPHHFIELPSPEEFRVLQIIAESKIASKKAILDQCVDAGLIVSKGKSGPYGHVVLQNRFISPLEERGLVVVDGRGRKARVKLTEEGINTLHLSGWFKA